MGFFFASGQAVVVQQVASESYPCRALSDSGTEMSGDRVAVLDFGRPGRSIIRDPKKRLVPRFPS